MLTMTKYAVVCLFFLYHTHSLVPSCLLFTEPTKKKKSKPSSSSEVTTFLPVPHHAPADLDTVDIFDEDFSDQDEDQAGFAQGHSQSQRVACKEPRVQAKKPRTESGKERAARLKRQQQQQLAQNQADLAQKRKNKSQTQAHLDESPRSTTHHLSAFRHSKEQIRLENQPASSDNGASSSEDEESDEEEASTNENHNPNIMGTSTTCNKNACKNVCYFKLLYLRVQWLLESL